MNLLDWPPQNNIEFSVKSGMSHQTEVLYNLPSLRMSPSIEAPISQPAH